MRSCLLICLSLIAICRGVELSAANEKPVIGSWIDETSHIVYPTSDAVIDITKAPYFAKGDGTTDDTEAIQKALFDVMGRHKLLYFPAGTYLVSKTLNWSKKNSAGMDAWGMNFLQGENASRTVIRLKDATFTDAEKPASIMWCGGFGSADWFHNYVQDITFDIGQNNPGAIGLQFYSNNSGAVRNCRFIAGEESGLIGLDLGHRDMNGPLLVHNCEVIGFERGIAASHAVNGQTFERITLRGQRQFGFDNEGQAISIRGLFSENSVPAVRSYGSFCLIESRLKGLDGANNWPAIINYNGGRIFVRDVKTAGYSRAIGDVDTPDWFASVRLTGDDKSGSRGSIVSEYCSHPPTSPFAATAGSLGLAIKETPAVPRDDPRRWANVDQFGADPTGEKDSAAAIQTAIDSGASTVFFPGSYLLKTTVVIRNKVQRLVGVGGSIDYFSATKPDFRIIDGEAPVLSLEHFANIHGGVEIDTSRTVVFRSVSDADLTFTERSEGGELFFEDFVTHNLKLTKQRCWARQLNVENEGTHVINDNSQLWVLGYKTERGGTLLDTHSGGASEILGGFSYTTTAGKLAPMFVTREASVFSFFNEICFNGDPFETLIQETRRGETKTVQRGKGSTAPYVSSPDNK